MLEELFVKSITGASDFSVLKNAMRGAFRHIEDQRGREVLELGQESMEDLQKERALRQDIQDLTGLVFPLDESDAEEIEELETDPDRLSAMLEYLWVKRKPEEHEELLSYYESEILGGRKSMLRKAYEEQKEQWEQDNADMAADKNEDYFRDLLEKYSGERYINDIDKSDQVKMLGQVMFDLLQGKNPENPVSFEAFSAADFRDWVSGQNAIYGFVDGISGQEHNKAVIEKYLIKIEDHAFALRNAYDDELESLKSRLAEIEKKYPKAYESAYGNATDMQFQSRMDLEKFGKDLPPDKIWYKDENNYDKWKYNEGVRPHEAELRFWQNVANQLDDMDYVAGRENELRGDDIDSESDAYEEGYALGKAFGSSEENALNSKYQPDEYQENHFEGNFKDDPEFTQVWNQDKYQDNYKLRDQLEKGWENGAFIGREEYLKNNPEEDEAVEPEDAYAEVDAQLDAEFDFEGAWTASSAGWRGDRRKALVIAEVGTAPIDSDKDLTSRGTKIEQATYEDLMNGGYGFKITPEEVKKIELGFREVVRQRAIEAIEKRGKWTLDDRYKSLAEQDKDEDEDEAVEPEDEIPDFEYNRKGYLEAFNFGISLGIAAYGKGIEAALHDPFARAALRKYPKVGDKVQKEISSGWLRGWSTAHNEATSIGEDEDVEPEVDGTEEVEGKHGKMRGPILTPEFQERGDRRIPTSTNSFTTIKAEVENYLNSSLNNDIAGLPDTNQGLIDMFFNDESLPASDRQKKTDAFDWMFNYIKDREDVEILGITDYSEWTLMFAFMEQAYGYEAKVQKGLEGFSYINGWQKIGGGQQVEPNSTEGSSRHPLVFMGDAEYEEIELSCMAMNQISDELNKLQESLNQTGKKMGYVVTQSAVTEAVGTPADVKLHIPIKKGEKFILNGEEYTFLRVNRARVKQKGGRPIVSYKEGSEEFSHFSLDVFKDAKLSADVDTSGREIPTKHEKIPENEQWWNSASVEDRIQVLVGRGLTGSQTREQAPNDYEWWANNSDPNIWGRMNNAIEQRAIFLKKKEEPSVEEPIGNEKAAYISSIMSVFREGNPLTFMLNVNHSQGTERDLDVIASPDPKFPKGLKIEVRLGGKLVNWTIPQVHQHLKTINKEVKHWQKGKRPLIADGGTFDNSRKQKTLRDKLSKGVEPSPVDDDPQPPEEYDEYKTAAFGRAKDDAYQFGKSYARQVENAESYVDNDLAYSEDKEFVEFLYGDALIQFPNEKPEFKQQWNLGFNDGLKRLGINRGEESTIDAEDSGMFEQLSDLFLALKHLEGQQFEADTFGQSFIKELATIEKITIDKENWTLSMLTNNAGQTGAGVEVRNGKLAFAIGSKEVSFMEMVTYLNDVRESAEKKKKEDKDAADRMVRQREEENLENLRKEKERKGKTGFDVGDTVYFFHMASNSWKPANYRGRIENMATVIYDGKNWDVPFDELKDHDPDITGEVRTELTRAEATKNLLDDFDVVILPENLTDQNDDEVLFYSPVFVKGMNTVSVPRHLQNQIVKSIKVETVFSISTGNVGILEVLAELKSRNAKIILQGIAPDRLVGMAMDLADGWPVLQSEIQLARKDGEISTIAATIDLLTKNMGQPISKLELAEVMGRSIYIRETYSDRLDSRSKIILE